MKVTRVWIALILVALGVFGALDAVGVVDSSRTIDRWWPLAIIGWAALEMIDKRHVTFALSAVAGLGIGLLASQQDWSIGGLLWSVLLAAAGVWLLYTGLSRSRTHRVDVATGTGHRTDAGPW